MNFFKLYPGDYQRDTGALTLAQHGAYLMMLQHYYATETPLPIGAALYRLLRAQTKAERDAIDFVAAHFWITKDGSLVNTRAVVELERAIRQRDLNREMGKRGGRPRRTQHITDSVSSRSTDGSKTETEHITDSVIGSEPIDNPNQTPDTRHSVGESFPHTTVTSQRERDPVCGETIRPEVQAAIELRKRGFRCTPHNPDLLAAVAEGVTVSALCDMAESYPGKPAGYVIAAARREHAQPPSTVPQGDRHALSPPGRKLSAVEQVQQAILDRRARESDGQPPAAA